MGSNEIEMATNNFHFSELQEDQNFDGQIRRRGDERDNTAGSIALASAIQQSKSAVNPQNEKQVD